MLVNGLLLVVIVLYPQLLILWLDYQFSLFKDCLNQMWCYIKTKCPQLV
jgi:hypothetical protein